MSRIPPYRWVENRKERFEIELEAIKSGLVDVFELKEAFSVDQGRKRDLLHGQHHQLDGSYIIFGELKFDGDKVQPIFIEVPPTFPDIPADVFPVTSFSKTENQVDYKPIQFGKGQQYDDGHMCLFSKKAWDKDAHGLAYIIRRAQKWLHFANSEDGFPTNEVVEEDLVPILPLGFVLLPVEYTPREGINKGMADFVSIERNNYIFRQMIWREDRANNISSQGWDPQNSPILKGRTTTCKGLWFAVPKTLKSKELFKGGLNLLIPTIQKHLTIPLGDEINNLALDSGERAILAFYLRSEKKWYFVALVNTGFGFSSTLNVAFLWAKSFPNELSLRIKDLYDISKLSNKTVTIVGLGSIGSEVAVELAKNGVNKFELFDNDTVDVGNTTRHAADLTLFNFPKVLAVEQLILGRKPDASVTSHVQDVMKATTTIANSLSHTTLAIVLTAEDHLEYMINDMAVRYSKTPLIFARTSIGALTGVVQIVLPGVSACLRCLDLYGDADLPIPNFGTGHFKEIPAGVIGCAQPTFPGSGIDTKEVAIQVSRVTMQLLMGIHNRHYPKLLGHQLRWHGPAGSNEKPAFTWEVLNHPPHANCPVCNRS